MFVVLVFHQIEVMWDVSYAANILAMTWWLSLLRNFIQ